jgi:hypothetical protein
MMRLTSGPALKLNPRNFRFCGRATALFASFTLNLSLLMGTWDAEPAVGYAKAPREQRLAVFLNPDRAI